MLVPSLTIKIKTFLILAKKLLEEQKLNFSRSGLFHMKSRAGARYFVSDSLVVVV